MVTRAVFVLSVGALVFASAASAEEWMVSVEPLQPAERAAEQSTSDEVKVLEVQGSAQRAEPAPALEPRRGAAEVLRSSDAGQSAVRLVRIDGRIFTTERRGWVEHGAKEPVDHRVLNGSDEWLELQASSDTMRCILALGPSVRFLHEGEEWETYSARRTESGPARQR